MRCATHFPNEFDINQRPRFLFVRNKSAKALKLGLFFSKLQNCVVLNLCSSIINKLLLILLGVKCFRNGDVQLLCAALDRFGDRGWLLHLQSVTSQMNLRPLMTAL